MVRKVQIWKLNRDEDRSQFSHLLAVLIVHLTSLRPIFSLVNESMRGMFCLNKVARATQSRHRINGNYSFHVL